ncbi:topoisomerase DNA-binding C4 zinc finger domain-containing protein, partial [Vibrio vulnificus]|nr:topoisomerase DNA-binding C4 zinc finger domain-containing protein [Vibrio vulnificus]
MHQRARHSSLNCSANTVAMSSKIDRTLFSAHEHALEHTPCPQCGGELVLKHGKHGAFLGCNQYPQ